MGIFHLLPVIKKWQLESSVGTATDVGSGVEVVNTFLSEMVTHFEQEGVPVQQVNGCHTQLTQPYLYGTLF